MVVPSALAVACARAEGALSTRQSCLHNVWRANDEQFSVHMACRLKQGCQAVASHALVVHGW